MEGSPATPAGSLTTSPQADGQEKAEDIKKKKEYNILKHNFQQQHDSLMFT